MSDEELLWLVRHKVRRRILLAVGEAGRISATSLKEKLGISTGSLYYNLRQLAPLITQDQRRNYMLTEQGERIYRVVTQQSPDTAAIKPPSKLITTLSNIFFPVWLFSPIYESAGASAIVGGTSIALIILLLVNARYELVLLHAVRPDSFSLQFFGLKLLLTLIAAHAYLSFVSWLLGGRAHTSKLSTYFKSQDILPALAEHGRFLACMMAAFLPMGLLPGVTILDRVFKLGLLTGEYSFIIRDVLLVISQTITVLLLTAAIAYAKKLRWQSALAAAFSFFYLSYGASYFIR